MSSDSPLWGRVALVTGASGGIGAAICRSLAAEGANVAAAYGRHASQAEALARELQEEGRGAVADGAHLADPGGPARLVGGRSGSR